MYFSQGVAAATLTASDTSLFIMFVIIGRMVIEGGVTTLSKRVRELNSSENQKEKFS